MAKGETSLAKQAARGGPRMRKLVTTERPVAAPVKSTTPKTSRIRRVLGGLRWLKPLLVPLRIVGKILKRLAPRYLLNAWRELRQVTWPNRRESWRLTGAVFVFAIIFGVLATIVDRGIDRIFKETVLK